MSAYGDEDFRDPWRSTRDNRAPPPYPTPSAAPGYDGGPYGDLPPPPAGGPPGGPNVPPPPMGEQLNRRPSALKREGSRSRVPHLQPQFPDEASYLGSKAPDLEAKRGPRHREFRDKRDGYESEEGEMLRKAKPRGDNLDEPDPRRRGAKDAYNDRQRKEYDDRGGQSRRGGYDDEDPPPPRRRKDRDRDRDRDYDDDPPPRSKRRDRDQPPGVEYGSDPVPAVRRSNTERPGRSQKSRRDYDDESSEDDRSRRQPPSRRRSQDDTRRRKRDYDDDRDRDYRDSDRRRKDDRGDRDRDRYGDDRRRDKSRDRGRYYDDDDDYYDRRSNRDRDRRRGSSAPPKEIKIGDYDIGPWVEKGKKSYGAMAPILTPIVINMARKYMRDKKR